MSERGEEDETTEKMMTDGKGEGRGKTKAKNMQEKLFKASFFTS